jgi:hypothetical protein
MPALPEHHTDLVRSHFAWQLAQSAGHIASDTVLASAYELVAPALRALRAAPDWNTATPLEVSAIRAHAMLYKPVRLLANVVELRSPVISLVPTRACTQKQPAFENADVVHAVLQDRKGSRIRTLHVSGDERVAEFIGSLHGPGSLEVLASVVPVPLSSGGRVSEYRLHVFAARRADSSLDLLMATPAERVQVRKLRAELRKRGITPGQYVMQRVIEGVGIEGIDEFPELRLGIEFVVLQAFSLGRIRHAPGKLNGLVVGPPGQGKKLLALCAALINPCVSEASAAKISAAGLSGANYPTADGWRSQPGLVPLADRGVVILQDAHAIPRAEAARLAALLQELMEDGVLRDAKAGGVRREVEVGLLMDANRLSQVYGTTPKGPEAAMLSLVPVLDRMDFLCEIGFDRQRAWRITQKLYANQDVRLAPLHKAPWVRELQLLVALMRDEHAVVDLSRVSAEMAERHERLAARIAQEFPGAGEQLDTPQRTSISHSRYVAAAARAADSSDATSAEVDLVQPLLETKLRFFARWSSTSRAAVAGTREAVAPALARAELYEGYRGKAVRLEDVARELSKLTDSPISTRSVRRDFIALGAVQARRGLWRLPKPYPVASKTKVAKRRS